MRSAESFGIVTRTGPAVPGHLVAVTVAVADRQVRIISEVPPSTNVSLD